MSIIDSPDPVIAGTNLTYTVQVLNNGPSAAQNVTLNGAVPAGTTFVSLAGAGGFTCSAPAAGAAGAISCSASQLATGATAVFTLQVKVAAEAAADANITNSVNVAAATPDSDSANNQAAAATTVATSADLAVSMTDAPDPVTARHEFDLHDSRSQ